MSAEVPRRMPRARDLKPLIRTRPLEWHPVRRRLGRATTVEDLRLIARRRTPRAAFDYADGAADREISLERARRAFSELEFRPRVLRDVSAVDTHVEVLGERFSWPFGIAPIGFTRMMHAAGERAGAGVAAQAGIPFTLSTMGTTSLEDVAASAPAGVHWFQLYMWRDRARSMALVERAHDAGYRTLLVTVDVPVSGARLRDVRNGLTIPPALTAKTLGNIVRHPAWWFDLLTTEPLAFASLDRWPGTVADLLDSMFDPTVDLADLAWLRDRWPGRIVVKGVQTVEDARLVADVGVDGIVLSNHGGRQLDRAPVPFRLLPAVREALGDRAAILVDTGIMSGYDIVACLALGADLTLVGRAYLYGLMAGGRDGVERVVELLTQQVTRTMRLLGARSVADLEPSMVAARS